MGILNSILGDSDIIRKTKVDFKPDFSDIESEMEKRRQEEKHRDELLKKERSLRGRSKRSDKENPVKEVSEQELLKLTTEELEEREKERDRIVEGISSFNVFEVEEANINGPQDQSYPVIFEDKDDFDFLDRLDEEATTKSEEEDEKPIEIPIGEPNEEITQNKGEPTTLDEEVTENEDKAIGSLEEKGHIQVIQPGIISDDDTVGLEEGESVRLPSSIIEKLVKPTFDYEPEIEEGKGYEKKSVEVAFSSIMFEYGKLLRYTGELEALLGVNVEQTEGNGKLPEEFRVSRQREDKTSRTYSPKLQDKEGPISGENIPEPVVFNINKKILKNIG